MHEHTDGFTPMKVNMFYLVHEYILVVANYSFHREYWSNMLSYQRNAQRKIDQAAWVPVRRQILDYSIATQVYFLLL